MSDLLALGKQRAEELGLSKYRVHNDWPDAYYYPVYDVHALLGAGIEIVGNVKNIDGSSTQQKYWTAVHNTGETHSALAIGIKPLVQVTAESLLRELVERNNAGETDRQIVQSIHMKAKALLEGGG